MENQKQSETVQIGNTTFYVIATFSGTVQLQHLIKRLIQKEIEQANIKLGKYSPAGEDFSMMIDQTFRYQPLKENKF